MTSITGSDNLRNVVVGLISTITLSGCFLTEEVPSTSLEPGDNVSLSGSVGDGPIVDAQMVVRSNDGVMLAEFQSDANAAYEITVKAVETAYPLFVEAAGGTDLVTGAAPDFNLIGALIESDDSNIANVNPFSTFTVELARNMPGGFTRVNVERSQEIVMTALNSGLTTLLGSGPMESQIDASNVAEIVRSSEVLAERVRRTRDWLLAAGFPSTGDTIVSQLAADLTDGIIDGNGATGVSARAAAVSTIVNAQVLLEAMANELRVNGVDATSAMRSAIDRVSTQPSNPTIDELTLTATMRRAARISLAAAFAVDESQEIRRLHELVSGMQPGQSSALARVLLPSNYRIALGQALELASNADDATLAMINAIARGDGEIDAPNLPPNIQGSPSTVAPVGADYSFTPSATDTDGDVLTFSISNEPSWANFDTATGELRGVPAMTDVGSYQNIVIGVSDGTFTVALPAFSIDVTAVNSAPQISGTAPSSVVVGNSYSFTPIASDPDGDTLVFSITGQPQWASFDSTTGELSGAPSATHVGTDAGIQISVSDGSESVGLAAFSITVNAAPVNSPPQISGSPAASVRVGETFRFTPTAFDADGDAVTFSVSALPSWANFNTSTGRLRGTPAAADVGVYSNIVISVSDGQQSADLSPFEISVEAISLGSVTLSWTAPTENDDGSALSDLAGYKLYWGTSPGDYTNSMVINNASVTTIVVDNLSPGTYEFVSTAFNSSGIESEYSDIASKVVP